MKWVLRAQQMEKDYAGQVVRGAEQAKQPAKQTHPQKATQPQPATTAPTQARPRPSGADESKGMFDAAFAERFYTTLYNQGAQEKNPWKFWGGHLGAGTVGLYRGFTGLAEQGVRDSLDLAQQGQAEGGLSGGLKTGLGYGLTFIPSQFTPERAPGSMMGLVSVPLLSAGAATNFGRTVLANPVVQKVVLPTIGLGGATISGKQMGDAATGKDVVTGEKLNEEERVSRGGQGVLGVAGSLSLLENTSKNIINGAKAIPANIGRLGRRLMGEPKELALPTGGNVNAAELNPNPPMRSQGSGAGQGEGFNQLDGSTRQIIEKWPVTIKGKVDTLLAKTQDDEVRRLIQSIVVRRSSDKAQAEVTYLVDSLLQRQQALPNQLTLNSNPLRAGGQNAVFEIKENPNLLVKKPLSGQSDFKNEYRALLKMESMGIETALVERTQIGKETVLVLKRIPGEISKTIMDVREGQKFRHLVKQRTIDDLEKIYTTLKQNETNIGDFQFMVREADGAVVVVDPKNAQSGVPPSREIEKIINDFKGYLNQNQRKGT
jgi:hypothetical protein